MEQSKVSRGKHGLYECRGGLNFLCGIQELTHEEIMGRVNTAFEDTDHSEYMDNKKINSENYEKYISREIPEEGRHISGFCSRTRHSELVNSMSPFVNHLCLLCTTLGICCSIKQATTNATVRFTNIRTMAKIDRKSVV